MYLKEQSCNSDESVISNLGEPVTETDFPNEYLTQTHDAYVDDMTEGTPDAPGKDLYTTMEAGYNYLNADVMLFHGGTLLRGRFIEHKCDVDGNHIE